MVIKLVFFYVFLRWRHENTTYDDSIKSGTLLPSGVQWVQWSSSVLPGGGAVHLVLNERNFTIYSTKYLALRKRKPSQSTVCFLNRILAILIPIGTRINSNCSGFLLQLWFIPERKNIAKGTWGSLIMWVICLWPFILIPLQLFSLNNREHRG